MSEKEDTTSEDTSADASKDGIDSSNKLSSTTTRTWLHNKNKRKVVRSFFPNEFKMEKPPTFNGDVRKYEEIEAWLLDSKKYFRGCNYSENMKVWVAIFNLRDNTEIW